MGLRTLVIISILGLACAAGAYASFRLWMPVSVQERLGLRKDISEIRTRVLPDLARDLASIGAMPGAPVYIRVFKEEAQLELYVKTGARFSLFRSYPICSFSGELGPKQREGDRQSPEGFYSVGLDALNPRSRFHLSFNLGFPNTFDQAHGRTGSYLMIHGDCVSIGCYAMTDGVIEEVYLLVEAALASGQGAVPVHAFPFRMTESRLSSARNDAWFEFWQTLAPAYAKFEQTGQPPEILVENGQYSVN